MLLDFYNLREQPFGVTPDPRYLYLGSAHRKAFDSLLYSIENKRGFSAIIAEPGMGKTSLLFGILDALQDSARTAFLFQTVEDSRELLRCLLYDLAIKCASEDAAVMRDTLNANLLQELRSGKQVVVVIDESQNLDGRILEAVRQLSNFETKKQKLMHIVLAGQPGLGRKLNEPSMTQLRQRISTIVRLEPFHPDEVNAYVNHRLQTAGLEGPSMFVPEALALIARVSQGIPRNINNLCFQALSAGYAAQSKQIGLSIVRRVVSELQLVSPSLGAPARQTSAGAELAAAPPAVPSAPSDSIRLGEFQRLGAWEDTNAAPAGSRRLKWLAGLACLAALPAALLALSDARFGLSQTVPGQISERVVNAVLSPWRADSVTPESSERAAGPNSPAATVPQVNSPPPATASNASGATDGAAASAMSSSAPVNEPRSAAAQQTKPEKTDAATAKSTVEEDLEASNQNRGELGRIRAEHAGTRDMPSTVQIQRSETLFQLAVELYGHSNWIIVEALCAANPDIHDPYAVLRVGQMVRLPTDLVTVTQDYNSKGTPRRSR